MNSELCIIHANAVISIIHNDLAALEPQLVVLFIKDRESEDYS